MMRFIFKGVFVSCLSFFCIKNVSGIKLSRASGVNGVNGVNEMPSPLTSRKSGKYCMLFFTGGSNLFQSDIYGEFIQTLESKDIDVYDVPFNYQISQEDIDNLYSEYNQDYNNINVMGHSSGCTTMLNQCVGLQGIKNMFLLDPVNTNFFKDNWKIKIENKDGTGGGITTLSFIRAMKSYKITFDPFGLPFIPIFELMAKDLYLYQDDVIEVDIDVVKNLDIENYGHSDILNKKLSDFMHNTRLSVGNKNREVESQKKYFDKILSFVLETIQ